MNRLISFKQHKRIRASSETAENVIFPYAMQSFLAQRWRDKGCKEKNNAGAITFVTSHIVYIAQSSFEM